MQTTRQAHVVVNNRCTHILVSIMKIIKLNSFTFLENQPRRVVSYTSALVFPFPAALKMNVCLSPVVAIMEVSLSKRYIQWCVCVVDYDKLTASSIEIYQTQYFTAVNFEMKK